MFQVGACPLHHAARSGCSEVAIAALVSAAPGVINATDSVGAGIHWLVGAARRGLTCYCCELLVTHQLRSVGGCLSQGRRNASVVHFKVAGTDMRPRRLPLQFGYTPLLAACEFSRPAQYQVVRRLLRLGADPLQMQGQGVRPAAPVACPETLCRASCRNRSPPSCYKLGIVPPCTCRRASS